jgi:hypothetical protein
MMAGFLLFPGFLPGLVYSGMAQNQCSGSACLEISNVRRGTRCGTRDSMEVDTHNLSATQSLRGTQFTCHATGSPEAIANTGNGEAVRYPPHN